MSHDITTPCQCDNPDHIVTGSQPHSDTNTETRDMACVFCGAVWTEEVVSDPEDADEGLSMSPPVESPNYRAAMQDAGRGHLLP